MPPDSRTDFHGLLRCFHERGIEFVVIEGVSAALQGVPALTMDLGLVLEPSEENLDACAELLRSLDACQREHLPRKRLSPARADLEAGAKRLMTKRGPLDILGRLATGWGFEDLGGSNTDTPPRRRRLPARARPRVPDRGEAGVGREKDLAVLPRYRRVLRESAGGENPHDRVR